MRFGFLALALLAAPGCITVYETYPESVASPEEAFLTIRAAVLSEQPDVLYECLSPEFKERHGIEGLRTFKLWYLQQADAIDDLATVLENAAIVNTEEVTPAGHGARTARVTVAAYGRELELTFVEVPTFTVLVALEDYPPERVRFEREWRDSLRLEGDRIAISERLPPELGVAGRDEVREVLFHVRWLLTDVRLPGGGRLSLPG